MVSCKRARGVTHFVATIGIILSASVFASAKSLSTQPWDWLIQHVCADTLDRPVAADPYDGCPTGAHERRLKLGDPMPYLRHDQPRPGHPYGFQRHDSYPLADQHFGGIISANDFDFDYNEPYGVMHPGDGDGYDVFRVADGYVSGSGTRDYDGNRQTLFGRGCKPFNGWVFFPVAFLFNLRLGASGAGVFPIHGDYYEQNGEPYPGHCGPETHFATGTLTTWSFDEGHLFGGLNGASQKRIDTIISTHGFPVSKGAHPHKLERFFFTDLYGVTRWEVWEPAVDNPRVDTNCLGSTEMDYQGWAFKRTHCHDWSAVNVFEHPKPRFPWPYPEANLLVDQHFDGAVGRAWAQTATNSETGAVLKLSRFQSKTSADTHFSRTREGVHYLQMNCGSRHCDPGQAMYQQVPIGLLKDAQAVDYGFSGVAEGSEGGIMHVELSQRDLVGRELWSTSFESAVPTQGSGTKPKKPADSIYASSTVFLETSPPLPKIAGAVWLRLSLSPRVPILYDILDTWLMLR